MYVHNLTWILFSQKLPRSLPIETTFPSLFQLFVLRVSNTAYLRDHKGEYEHWDPSKMETIMGYMEHSRKRTANKLITGILWSAYLLADWAVGFAIGLIANSDWSSGLNTMEAKNRYSFWASFLLVHLGERTHAFYLASSDRFKDSIIGVGDLGENYVNLIRVIRITGKIEHSR
ncbi:hypothetical protein Tco_1170184 [Tanacetum coccineum]